MFLAKSEKDMEEMIQILKEEIESNSLEINFEKTQCMYIVEKGNYICVEDKKNSICDTFKYLG